MKKKSTPTTSGNGKKIFMAIFKAESLRAFLTQIRINRSKKTVRHAGQRRGGGNAS